LKEFHISIYETVTLEIKTGIEMLFIEVILTFFAQKFFARFEIPF